MNEKVNLISLNSSEAPGRCGAWLLIMPLLSGGASESANLKVFRQRI